MLLAPVMISALKPWTPLALALVLAGCGDDGGGSDSETTGTTTTTSTTSPTSTEGSSGPDTGSSSGTSAGGDLSHAADIQPIWDAACVVACHDDNPMSSGTASTGLQLLPEVAYDSLVGKMSVKCNAQQLVEPGKRDTSFLWHKLDGSQTLVCAGGGSKMPLGKTLTPEQIETIGQWIDQGAPP